MAEALALGAGVVAFIQLTDRVIHLAKYFIEAIRDCPRDIRTILVEVSSLKAVLENLDFLLKTDSGPEPQMLEQLHRNGLMAECKNSLAKLERLLPSDIKTVNGRRQKIMTAVEHLKWPLRENTARKLIDEISRYKASIAFALTFDSTRDIKDIKSDVRWVKESLTTAERNEVCTWLEITNPSSNHNNAWRLHEDHTGLWMIESQEWQEWLEGKMKFMWIHGIPGAGKTVLASFLIEETKKACAVRISGDVPNKPVVCVYYYCYFARNQDEAAPFLGWLIGQLCRQCRLIPSEIDRLYQLLHVPSISQLLSAFEILLEEFEAVFVVVDAVDESQSRENLLKVLRDCATDHRFDKVRLLATSREYYDIETYFSDISSKVSMSNSAVEKDIGLYVHSALLSNKRFQAWPPTLVTEVENALSTGAKGMFRWAVCQIDVLQRLRREEDVRIAVSNLPKTLDETYERIFQLLAEEDHHFVRLALIFICGNNSFRPIPLAANVLLQAVRWRLESSHKDDGSFNFYTHDMLKDRCGCLISFAYHAGVECVSLAHYTVAEFIYSDRISHTSVRDFALSDSLVRATIVNTALEVVIEKQDENPSLTHSLHSYSILVEAWKGFRDEFTKAKTVKGLAEQFDILKSDLVYLRARGEIIEKEREAVNNFQQFDEVIIRMMEEICR